MKNTRIIAVSEQDFKQLRLLDRLYVDKTQKIYELFKDGKYYFLSRPRRFGKSMLCSTLRELFLGNREFFKGLWIDQSDWEWKKHPVIHLDMTSASGKDKKIEDIERGIFLQLKHVVEEFGIQVKEEDRVEAYFSEILISLHKKTGLGVVVIIDEYDKPMLDALGYPEHMKNNHALLQRFYAQLKNSSPYLRLVFLTGVYKFAQTSVFSGLNNIQDLTFNILAGDLCGYTQEEIEINFGPEIEALMEKRQKSRLEFLQELQENYNGYIFGYDYDSGKLSRSVYNSFAINSVFAKNSLIKNNWFSTGSPSFLITQLETRHFEAIRPENLNIASSQLINSCDPEKITIETLLYFAGYVTIKSYVPSDDVIQLCLPNKDVSKSLAEEILPRMTEKRLMLPKQAALEVRNAWREEDFELVKQNLNICLAMLHNRLYTNSESYFHTVIMMFLHVADMRVEAEVGSKLGDVDLVLWLNKKIYVIEIKMDRSVNEAMKQIHKRKYYTSLLAEKLPITLVGMRCSSEERAIVDLNTEQLLL